MTTVTIYPIYPTIKATVNGKSYLAIDVYSVTYLIWSVARDTGCNLTKVAAGDVEINGSKPSQVFDGRNTYIKWSDIPTILPNPTRVHGVWEFQTNALTPLTTSPILDLTAPNIKGYVYAKTNVGGWFFDAVLNMNHTSTLTITSHPVQSGSSISDYAFMQPRTLSMNIAMSDVAKSFISGQFTGGSSRSVQAFKVLQQLQAMRIPIQVYTRLGLYQNMLVQTITTPDDNTTANGLKCTVDFQEVLVASVEVVKVSSNPAVTGNAAKGAKQPIALTSQQQSLLYQFINGVSKVL